MASQLDICNLALLRLGEDTITQSELTNESTRPAKLCSNFWSYIRDEVLSAHPWHFAKKTRPLDLTDDFGEYSDDDYKDITNITQADPAVVSCASHPFVDGNLVLIEDVTGMTEVNDRVFEIADVDGNSFQLVGVDSTKYTAYSSGGTAIRAEALSDYSSGYTYDYPSDCLRPLKIDGDGDFMVIGEGANKRILTTTEDAVLIYIAQITDSTKFSNRFVSVMAARLAAELAIPLKKKGAKFKEMMDIYGYLLGTESVKDAKEGKETFDDDDTWVSDAGIA